MDQPVNGQNSAFTSPTISATVVLQGLSPTGLNWYHFAPSLNTVESTVGSADSFPVLGEYSVEYHPNIQKW